MIRMVRQLPGAQKFTAEQMADAIRASYGIRAVTARRLNCNIKTVSEYIKRYVVCQRAEQEGRDLMCDMAESVVVRHLNDNALDAAKYVLSTRGKHRGWGQSTEISGPNGGPVAITTIVVERPVESSEDDT